MDTFMDTFKITNEYLEHLHPRAINKLEAWINHGGFLSSFWQALLEGRYGDAACNADPEMLACFGWLIRFLERTAPGECWGSPEAVETWSGLNASQTTKHAKPNIHIHDPNIETLPEIFEDAIVVDFSDPQFQQDNLDNGQDLIKSINLHRELGALIDYIARVALVIRANAWGLHQFPESERMTNIAALADQLHNLYHLGYPLMQNWDNGLIAIGAEDGVGYMQIQDHRHDKKVFDRLKEHINPEILNDILAQIQSKMTLPMGDIDQNRRDHYSEYYKRIGERPTPTNINPTW